MIPANDADTMDSTSHQSIDSQRAQNKKYGMSPTAYSTRYLGFCRTRNSKEWAGEINHTGKGGWQKMEGKITQPIHRPGNRPYKVVHRRSDEKREEQGMVGGGLSAAWIPRENLEPRRSKANNDYYNDLLYQSTRA